MSTAFDNLIRIITPGSAFEHRLGAMRDFAKELEWTPSYEFETGTDASFVRDHLVVEHGLENAAVISFVRSPHRTNEFDRDQLKSLLAISYNNLIEWHIFVSSSEVRCINNLSYPDSDISFPLDRSNLSELLSGTLVDQKLFQTTSRRAFGSCDDVFIQVVSRWKRLLKADLGGAINNANISALFNALIFLRACEDLNGTSKPNVRLLEVLGAFSEDSVDVGGVIAETLSALGYSDSLAKIMDLVDLDPFRKMDFSTAYSLIKDFYKPSASPYDFNFAWMSKHALSRIYERYVSILEFPDNESTQLSFINAVPDERRSTRTGSVYTPQFVAGFFARYLRDNMTPRSFRTLSVIDPACGSGIFLRTLLEQRCNPLVPGTTSETISQAFKTTFAIDRDANAAASTRLSLTLLHLVATGKVPEQLNVTTDDAIRLILSGSSALGSYGAVLANPPYIKLDHLGAEDRATLAAYMGEGVIGRMDSYLAFVKFCLEACEPLGFVCLVLPQVFMTARNARLLRKQVAEEFDVRCIVDLTEISVFEGVGTYNILLIAQRRSASGGVIASAQIARVRGYVGPALQACLDRRSVTTTYYDVFETGQATFREENWTLLSSADTVIGAKLSELRPIGEYLNVKQGFLSGADSVFILPKKMIPNGEESVFIDYLPDRAIRKFAVPPKADAVVFYPFENGKPLIERDLRKRYPKTWKYLNSHKKHLSERKSVVSGDTPWWRPVRPRDPKNILRPKIVCPHLMLTPRFAVDKRGSYAVSHSPFLISRESAFDISTLKFFCAVLNSSVVQWFIQTHAPKYAHGYNRIEVALLRDIPVPNPAGISSSQFNDIVKYVDRLSGRNPSKEDNDQLDELISNLYGLLPDERRAVMGHAV
jgi:hypothetical protein